MSEQPSVPPRDALQPMVRPPFVAPQPFELAGSPQHEFAVDVPEGGVVVAAEDRLRAVSGVLKQLQDLGFSLTDFADSAIAGKSGNVEVFVWARRAS